jgi:putative nucleotidyltransferase with HDIG domain
MNFRKEIIDIGQWSPVIEALPLPVALVDPDLKITAYNKAFATLYGIVEPAGEIGFYELVHRSEEPVEDCPLAHTLIHRKECEREIFDPVRGKFIRAHCSPLYVDGRITAAVFTVINSGEKDGTEKSDDTLIDVLAEAIIDMKAREVKVQMVRDAFFNMLEDVNESYQELEELFLKLIRVLINVLDAKSPWTKGHSERVSRYAEAIAEEMGLDDDNIRDIKLAGLLHDIGKIGTYDYLLDKPGKLTREEYELVMKHPAQGALILKGIKQLEDILPLIHYHHEKLDGKGYPNGLHGDQIPVGARILHVADSFDSMTSDRPYRKAPGIEFALMEFEKYKGTQFDPQVVDAFMNILDRKIFSTG